MTTGLRAAAVLATVLWSSPSLAGTWGVDGEVAAQVRGFRDDGDARTHDLGLALAPELKVSFESGAWKGSVRGFGRTDAVDSRRGLAAVQEAWLGLGSGGWQVRAGAEIVDWSANEVFHPADSVNSRIYDDEIENPRKVGEWMVTARRRINGGDLSLHWMPRYESPWFPDGGSRLSRGPAGVTLGNPLWVRADGTVRRRPYGSQWAARLNQPLGWGDFSLHVLEHHDRQYPQMTPVEGEPRPAFLPVREIGGTYLHVLGGAVARIEGVHRNFRQPSGGAFAQEDHFVSAAGLEFTWAHRSGAQSTLIAEGQALLGPGREVRTSQDLFQRDVFLGYRRSWNDEKGRELNAGVIVDLETAGEYFVSLRYAQRLSDTWGVRLSARYARAPRDAAPDGLASLDGSDHVAFELVRSF